MKKRFDELVKQILHGIWEEDPVEATFLGIHAYDEVLARTDPPIINSVPASLAH
jgi:hypothetical protein